MTRTGLVGAVAKQPGFTPGTLLASPHRTTAYFIKIPEVEQRGHRTIKYPRSKGPSGSGAQLLCPQGTPKNLTVCLSAVSEHSLSSVGLGAVPPSLARDASMPTPVPRAAPRLRFPLRLPGSSTATAPLPGSRFPGAPLTPRGTHLGPGAVLHAAAGLHGERGRLRPPWRGAPRAAGPGPGPGPNPSPGPGPGSSSRHRPAGAGSRKGPPGARLRGAAAGSLHEGSLHGSRARSAQPLPG